MPAATSHLPIARPRLPSAELSQPHRPWFKGKIAR
jgi:hypothetical protein